MRMTFVAVLLALWSSGLSAQNPPAPAAITTRLDTPQVRVYVATLQPRTPSISRNGHATNRVLIYLDDGVMTRKEGDQTTRIEFKRGDVRWRPASGAYTSENNSDRPIRILEVDLQGAPMGPLPATPLDPPRTPARAAKACSSLDGAWLDDALKAMEGMIARARRPPTARGYAFAHPLSSAGFISRISVMSMYREPRPMWPAPAGILGLIVPRHRTNTDRGCPVSCFARLSRC